MGKGTEVRRGKSHRGTTELSKGRALALQGGTQARQRNGGVMVRDLFLAAEARRPPRRAGVRKGYFYDQSWLRNCFLGMEVKKANFKVC